MFCQVLPSIDPKLKVLLVMCEHFEWCFMISIWVIEGSLARSWLLPERVQPGKVQSWWLYKFHGNPQPSFLGVIAVIAHILRA